MAASAKPKSIISFNRLNLAATVVGIANIFGHYARLRNLAISNGASPAGPILSVFFLVLSYLIFWFFIYRRGSDIAKWLFVAVTALSIAIIPFNLHKAVAIGIPYAVIDGIAFAFQIAATAILLRGDAKALLTKKSDRQAGR